MREMLKIPVSLFQSFTASIASFSRLWQSRKGWCHPWLQRLVHEIMDIAFKKWDKFLSFWTSLFLMLFNSVSCRQYQIYFCLGLNTFKFLWLYVYANHFEIFSIGRKKIYTFISIFLILNFSLASKERQVYSAKTPPTICWLSLSYFIFLQTPA